MKYLLVFKQTRERGGFSFEMKHYISNLEIFAAKFEFDKSLLTATI